MLDVVTPGLFSTIQDLGRPQAAQLGVPVGGACDPWSHAVANALLDNPIEAATLEVTLVGPELIAVEACLVAIAGNDFGVWIPEVGRRVPPGSTCLVQKGQHLVFGGEARGGGVRGYLALQGGIMGDAVLGSLSTCLVGGFGGTVGRPLIPGDRIVPRCPSVSGLNSKVWPEQIGPPLPNGQAILRVVEGPDWHNVDADVAASMLSTEWLVHATSNRVGMRLQPETSTVAAVTTGAFESQPMVWGAVQLPPNGWPIVLAADHPTVGGYPVPFVVARVDWPVLGQLRSGDRVEFRLVPIDAAQSAYRASQKQFRGVVESLRTQT